MWGHFIVQSGGVLTGWGRFIAAKVIDVTLFLPLSPHETDFTEILRVTLLPPRPLFQNTSNNRIVVPPSDIEPLELNSNTTLLLLQLGNKFDHIV